MTVRPLVLASSSPRRRELLASLGLEFTVVAPDLDEIPLPGEGSLDLVRRLAVAKAAAVAVGTPGAVVIGADTAVDVDGERSSANRSTPMTPDACCRPLSGRIHVVHTGVAVVHDGEDAWRTTSSEVAFTQLTDDDIEWYLGTGEPFDKAGAYALQGAGGVFVRSVSRQRQWGPRPAPPRDVRPSRQSGEDSCQTLTRRFPRIAGDTDLPQMREGGLALSGPVANGGGRGLRLALAQIEC